MITVAITHDSITPHLHALVGKLKNMAPVLDDIGDLWLDDVQLSFLSGGRPKWMTSQRVVYNGGTTLVDTGDLYNSFFKTRPTDSSIQIASDTDYGHAHQHGSTVGRGVTLPVREMFVGHADTIAATAYRIEKYLSGDSGLMASVNSWSS